MTRCTESHRWLTDKELGFTSPINEQEDFTWLWMARGMFRFEYRRVRPACSQRGPHGLSAPSSMNDASTERQHLR
jgi:hypothetical protein